MSARAFPVFALLLAACAGSLPQPRTRDGEQERAGETPQVVPTMPPPGQVQFVSPRPPEMKHPVWVDGEWSWNGRRWAWKVHGWVDEPPDQYYVPPLTKRLADGSIVHFPSFWKKAESPPR